MPLRLFDTRTQQLRDLTPADAKVVTMYVCGPTVYNYIHIGNARPAVVFDILFRALQARYPKVKFVRNITDIDDKINQAAKTQNQSIRKFTQHYIQAYHEDLTQLGCQRPTHEPLCTDHIADMIAMIEQLIEKRHAYSAEQHVLFDVTSMSDYGALSHIKLEELLAGARVEAANYKRNSGDFVLWKPSSDDMPGWPSPWGIGRPGWHIECSAMINAHIGPYVDIHGGGIDLTFPHHENERAQSNCCHNTESVGVWLHNGYVQMKGEKMSKSLGNFVSLRSLLGEHHPEVVRYALLATHYRAPLEWSEQVLEQARNNLTRFYQVLRDDAQHQSTPTPVAVDALLANPLLAPFQQALEQDLNTALCLSELHQLCQAYFTAQSTDDQRQLAQALRAGAQQLGLLGHDWQQWFQQAQAGLSHAEIEQAITKRAQAKTAKNYQLADQIRSELLNAGVELEDTAAGTRWQRS